MTNTGLQVLDNYSIKDFVDASPRDFTILGEQAVATLPKSKFEFFDFEGAEQFGYTPEQIAKEIETQAKNGNIEVHFDFDKFKLDTNNNYNLMYQALKNLPNYEYNKAKRNIGNLLKTKLRDRAKEALNNGEIDRAEFDKIYRFSRFFNPKLQDKAINPNKIAVLAGETITGALQDTAGLTKTGAQILNELGADIDTTGLDALITHYDNTVREYQHQLGEEDNIIFTGQNLGSLLLGFGVLGKAWKSTKYTAGFTERVTNHLINGAVASGLGYVTAVGRNEKNPEDAAAFGLLGGIAMSSALHNLSKLGMSSYSKLEQALVETLKLSEDDVSKAVDNYAKYMDIDDITSPKTKVEAILTHYGADLNSIIIKAGNQTSEDVIDLKRFINARKEALFKHLEKDTVDIDELGAKISEANVLAQHMWDKVTRKIGDNLVDLPEDIVKKAPIDTPLDALDDITKSNIARVKEVLEKPTVEGLMEADKAINNILRGLKNNKSKARQWSEFKDKINRTLEEVMPKEQYQEWLELKGIYKQVAKVRDSKVGKILTSDLPVDAKLQKLSRLSIDIGDFRSLKNLIGEKETAKLEKAIIKEVMGNSAGKKTWNTINSLVKNKGFITKEGKMLQEFISDMSKHFKLDDEIRSIQHAFERTAGFREDIWGALRANIIGRIGMKLAGIIVDVFKSKPDRLDSIMYDYLNTIYKNPTKVKEFNIRVSNLDDTLLDRLRKEAVEEAYQSMDNEFANGKYYNATHDILIDGKGNVLRNISDDFDDPDDFNPINPKKPNNPKTPKGGGSGNFKVKEPYEYPSANYQQLRTFIENDFKSLNMPNGVIKSQARKLHNLLVSKLIQTLEYSRKYNETLPASIDKLVKAIYSGLDEKDIMYLKPYIDKAIDLFKQNFKYAMSVHIPKNLSVSQYKELLTNPTKELELLQKEGTYIDLFGIPKQLTKVKFVDEFMKRIRVINNKTDGSKLKIEINPEMKGAEIKQIGKDYVITLRSKDDLAHAIHEYQHYIAKRFKDLLGDDIFEQAKILSGGIPQHYGYDNYVSLIGEIEARYATEGFKTHPIVDMLNEYKLNLKELFYNKSGVSKPREVFPKELEAMYPLFNKIKTGTVTIDDLPEIRRYIAFRYRNPSYISNPYAAEHYGISVNWENIDPKKLSKYKTVYEEGKHFKVIPTLLTGSGLTFANYIQQNEGLRLTPYKDTTGNWTIGYGHKLTKEELKKYKGGISQIEAEELFRKDLGWTKSRLKKLYPNFDTMPINVQLVLEDMAFNLGINGLAKFKKFKQALLNKDYQKASREILDSKYAEQVPNRAYKNAALILSSKV